MNKTGQSLSLKQLSLLRPSPQECKKEKKVKANYVVFRVLGFLQRKDGFLEIKKQNKI